jgi:drug/metabolite transporter (DMT)-like permease
MGVTSPDDCFSAPQELVLHADRATYLKGVALSAGGMLVISPDGLLLRLVEEASHWQVVFLRALGIFVAITALVLIRYRGRSVGMVRSLGWPGVWAAFGLMGANIGFVMAMLNTTVANALVILACMPLFSAVFGWLLIRERVSRRTWISIAVAIVGIIIIFSGSIGGGNLLGDCIALLTAVCHGFALVQLRRVGNRDTTPVIALGALGAATLALPLAGSLVYTLHDAGVILFQGLLQMPLAIGLFMSGARFIPAAEVALFSLIETVLGPLWAWIGVGEVPGTLAVVGGVIVVGAVAANAAVGLLRAKKREPSRHQGEAAAVLDR